MSETPETAFARFRQSGDAAALAVAFDAVAGDLLRVAAFLLPRDEVEDAVHDTFVVAMTRGERFDAKERLLPWLLGILANEARMRRRRRRLQERPLPLPRQAPVDPAVDATAREVGECVAQAMAALHRDESALLHLHLFEELSCREIGERLQRNAGTVRTQVSRAMSRLRQKLPQGLAGVAVFGTIQDGVLAAVRERVLASAAGMPVIAAADAGRSVPVKAMAGALVLLVGVAVAWLLWPTASDGSARRDDVARSADPLRTGELAQPPANATAGVGANEAVRTPIELPSATWRQRGLVHEPDGKPIPGARIVLRLEEFAPPLCTAVSGSDGRYDLDLSYWQKRPALDRSRRGPLTTITAHGHHSSVQFGSFAPSADPAQALELSYDFELRAYPTLHGRVVDPDGGPVPAKVRIRKGDQLLAVANAEPDGTFNLVVPGQESGDVRVEAEHWSGCRAAVTARVESGTGTEVGTLQLLPGNPLAGTVTLADGTPLGGARVWAGGMAAPYWHVEPVTDARGRFTVVRPGTVPCRLFVLGSGGERYSKEQEVAGDATEVRILVEGTLVELRWLDPAGNELLPQHASLTVFEPGTRHVAVAAQGSLPEAVAKAIIRGQPVSGEQVVVPAGSHLLLQAGAKGGLQVNQLVDVPAGGWRHTVTLHFTAIPRAPLAVRIRFRDGSVPELFNCTVSAAGGSVAAAEEVGREPGLCRWLVPIGPVQVMVGAYPAHFDDATETFTANVTADTDNVCEAVLTRRGRFALLLRDAAAPDRIDDRNVSASVTVAGSEVGHFVYTDGDMEVTSSEPPIGRLAEVLTMLPLGRHEVRAAVDGFEPVSAFVDVVETKVAEVTLLLTRKAQPAGK